MKPKHRKQTQNMAWFWITICTIILCLIYAFQTRYNPKKETDYALRRLNYWRAKAGVPPLERNKILERVAQKQAQYLSIDMSRAYKLNSSDPNSTSKTPDARATAAGYSAPISESIFVSSSDQSGSRSIDELMTNLRHRIVLLDATLDEVGIAWANNENTALVINQGESYIRELCDNPPSGSRYILTTQCNGKPSQIKLNELPPVPNITVKFPIGRNVEPTTSNTLNRELYPEEGNPISIAFFGQKEDIHMESFTLHAPDGQIRNIKVLTDLNLILKKNEFALLPVEPLAFNTEYHVKFHYRQGNEQKVEEWKFHTRKKRHWFE